MRPVIVTFVKIFWDEPVLSLIISSYIIVYNCCIAENHNIWKLLKGMICTLFIFSFCHKIAYCVCRIVQNDILWPQPGFCGTKKLSWSHKILSCSHNMLSCNHKILSCIFRICYLVITKYYLVYSEYSIL